MRRVATSRKPPLVRARVRSAKCGNGDRRARLGGSVAQTLRRVGPISEITGSGLTLSTGVERSFSLGCGFPLSPRPRRLPDGCPEKARRSAGVAATGVGSATGCAAGWGGAGAARRGRRGRRLRGPAALTHRLATWSRAVAPVPDPGSAGPAAGRGAPDRARPERSATTRCPRRSPSRSERRPWERPTAPRDRAAVTKSFVGGTRVGLGGCHLGHVQRKCGLPLRQFRILRTNYPGGVRA